MNEWIIEYLCNGILLCNMGEYQNNYVECKMPDKKKYSQWMIPFMFLFYVSVLFCFSLTGLRVDQIAD